MPSPRPFIKSITKAVLNQGRPEARRPFMSGLSQLNPTGGDVPFHFARPEGRALLDRVLKNYLPEVPPGYTRIYRADPTVALDRAAQRRLKGMNRNLPGLDEVAGQWFTKDINDLHWYLQARPDAKILWADIPDEQLDRLSAFEHSVTLPFAENTDEYILPHETPRHELSFDTTFQEGRPLAPRRIGPGPRGAKGYPFLKDFR